MNIFFTLSDDELETVNGGLIYNMNNFRKIISIVQDDRNSSSTEESKSGTII